MLAGVVAGVMAGVVAGALAGIFAEVIAGIFAGVREEEAGGAEHTAKVLLLLFVPRGHLELSGDCGNGTQQELADVGDEMGLARSDAIIGHHEQEPAEGEIDAGGGAITIEGTEQVFQGRVGRWEAVSQVLRTAGGRAELLAPARVVEAIGRMAVHPVAAAAASSRVAVIAAPGGISLLRSEASDGVGELASGQGWGLSLRPACLAIFHGTHGRHVRRLLRFPGAFTTYLVRHVHEQGGSRSARLRGYVAARWVKLCRLGGHGLNPRWAAVRTTRPE